MPNGVVNEFPDVDNGKIAHLFDAVLGACGHKPAVVWQIVGTLVWGALRRILRFITEQYVNREKMFEKPDYLF